MRFDAKTFPFLNDDGQYLPGWTNLEFNDLKAYIDDLIAQEISDADAPDVFKAVEAMDAFLVMVGVIEPTEAILSIKIDDNGLLETVVGPAIYAETAENEDGKQERTGGMVCRIGDYSQPVTIKAGSTEAAINGFKGDVSVEERGEGDSKYIAVSFGAYVESITDDLEVSFILDAKERPEIGKISKGKLKNLVKEGGLVDLLKVVPSGESFVKPRDLEVGEYSVISIEENEPHPEYGRSWKIVLEGVGPMMSTGKRLETLLASNALIYQKYLNAGKPLTFLISSKKEMSQGIQVNCGFMKREPRADRLVKAAKPAAAVASAPQASLPKASQTTVEAKAEPVEQKELEHVF
ncbi:MAG: hypothetical protein AAF609_18485 [Cyanobacteria bacterium P01_C01_bin.120]